MQNHAGRAPPYRDRVIARQEPGEPAPRAGREHHRVAVECLCAIDKCTVPRTEQHREFRWYFHKARCPVKLSSRTVEQDVVPHARASGPARNPSQRPLQLHHDHDRQTRPVSLSQQVGCDDRLISLRCALVGDKKMLVCNVAQRSRERGIRPVLDRRRARRPAQTCYRTRPRVLELLAGATPKADTEPRSN